MMLTVKVLLNLLVIYQAFDGIQGLDPVFKFIPKTSLLGLKVQNVVEIDLQMVLGHPSASPAVFKVNGPLTNGHAGMTVKSFEKASKGTNVNCPDFDTAPTSPFSSKLDGLYDVGVKNFSKLQKQSSSETDTVKNTASLLAKMTVVDTPGAVASDNMWVWASAELGDEYVWVSEELTTISRSASDRAYLNYSVEINGATEPSHTGIEGSMNTVTGSITHHAASRINAYNVVIRYFFSPYVEYVAGSFASNPKASAGAAKLNSQNNENELVIEYLKVGITDKPTYSFNVRFRSEKVQLREGQTFNGTFTVLLSYCSKATCNQNLIQEKFTSVVTQKFQKREKLDTFKIQHVPSGRCLSFTSGSDGNKIMFKAACADEFTYDANGGLKHVASSACAFLENNERFKMSSTKCDASDVAIMTRSASGKLLLRDSNGIQKHCAIPRATGVEDDMLVNGSCATSQINFRYLRQAATTSGIAVKNKVILTTTDNQIFFCSRSNQQSDNACYHRNTSETWKALTSALVTIKAYDPTSGTVYGIHSSRKSYAGIALQQDPDMAFQIEDSLWNLVKSQSGTLMATEITEANLKNYPVQVSTSNFAISLRGIYEKKSDQWKHITGW